jgi:hypothetical protein
MLDCTRSWLNCKPTFLVKQSLEAAFKTGIPVNQLITMESPKSLPSGAPIRTGPRRRVYSNLMMT